MTDETPAKGTQNPILIPGVVAVVYAVLNAVSVFAPFIPGRDVIIAWGLVFPLIAIIWTWIWFAKLRKVYGSWFPAAILFSLLYGLGGFGTLLIIAQIGASV